MSEARSRADFSFIRYAQCWEDADILLEALDPRPGHTCVSIASAGDNALAMLGRGPERVVALDLNPAQIACVDLRVAAYRELEYEELLRLIGSRPGRDRVALYKRCRSQLSNDVRRFWDERTDAIEAGIGGAGKFENYFRLFRTRILPLVHNRPRINKMFEAKSRDERETFYRTEWNSWRWRLMFRAFFSRTVIGRLGRDPTFFDHVTGSVSERISARAKHALTALDPASNPYLQWIFYGTHTTSLPYALRRENFESIRAHLDRLECRQQPIEDFLRSCERHSVDRYNLSDIFEYMSSAAYENVLKTIVEAGALHARLVYWNMLVPRTRPEAMADRIRPLSSLATELHAKDKAFFYSVLVIEELT